MGKTRDDLIKGLRSFPIKPYRTPKGIFTFSGIIQDDGYQIQIYSQEVRSQHFLSCIRQWNNVLTM